jgi:hypothetical protein
LAAWNNHPQREVTEILGSAPSLIKFGVGYDGRLETGLKLKSQLLFEILACTMALIIASFQEHRSIPHGSANDIDTAHFMCTSRLLAHQLGQQPTKSP